MIAMKQLAFTEPDATTWSDADYKRLLAELDGIFHAKRGEPAFERLNALATLIENYEEKRYSISEWAAGGKMTDKDVRSY